MEQRYPMFGRIGTLVHPVFHPRDEPALVDLGAAAPRVVVPLTGEGLDQPGGLGAQDVEQVLIGQRQGVPGDVKSSSQRFSMQREPVLFPQEANRLGESTSPHIPQPANKHGLLRNLSLALFNRNQLVMKSSPCQIE